jgi:hypothetical protein
MTNSLNNWSLKFVRWGMGLSILGLISGYFPLGHYLMKDSLPSCPAAPVHGHVILLSFVGMSVFGLLYRGLLGWMSSNDLPWGLIRAHFIMTVIGVIGICLNGTLGYEVLALFVQPHFYYIAGEGQTVRNLWFGIDGVFLSLYAVGCLIFLYTLMKYATYKTVDQFEADSTMLSEATLDVAKSR